MFYPPEVIDEVRAQNDIVDVVGAYVSLRPRSGSFFGLCPFHREKTPSFSVSPERQTYHCFGCGAGGNVISFVMQIENYDFPEALRHLADRAHFTLPQTDGRPVGQNREAQRKLLAEMNRIAARFFYDYLRGDTSEAAGARAYLARRGVDARTAVRFGLGLSPPGWDGLLTYMSAQGHAPPDAERAGLAAANKVGGYYDRFRARLMFPILDLTNKVVGFGGRVLAKDGDGAKYLNSPETPLFEKSRQLYGLNLARKARSSELVLVEGYMDCIALHQAGFTHTAGVLGTALTADHARLIKRVNCSSVVLLLDSDAAGTQAALRAIPVLLGAGLNVRVAQVTGAKDPDEFLQAFGAQAFGALLKNAAGHVAFRVNVLRRKHDLNATEGRVAFTKDCASLLASLDSAIETDAYASEVAAQTGIAADAINAEVRRIRETASARPWPEPPVRRNAARVNGGGSGLKSARMGLVQLAFADASVCRALQTGGAFAPEEMGDALYEKLLTAAFDAARQGRVLPPADAISLFDSLEEQRRAAETFLPPVRYKDAEETEKALTDMVITVKRAYLTERINQDPGQDPEVLRAIGPLLQAMKELNTLRVRISP